MPNVVFDNYAFPITGSGTVARTQPNREADVYNVKEYGAKGDSVTNDAAAIQAAVNAANTAGGGIIFFPPGIYVVNTAITFAHDSQASLRIVGSGGGGTNGSSGTSIVTSNQIWIFQTDHAAMGPQQGGGQPYCSIEHICFKNNFNPGAHGTITSTEVSGGGFGCIYMTAGIAIAYRYCCFICSNGGICFFNTGIATVVDSCIVQNNYAYTHAEDSYGIVMYQGTVSNGKISQCGVAIMCANKYQGNIIVENMDLESNGCAALIGDSTIAQWSQYDVATFAAGAYQVAYAELSELQLESNGDTDSSLANNFPISISAVIRTRASDLVMKNILGANLAGTETAKYFLWLIGIGQARIMNMFSHNSSPAGFSVANYFTDQGINNVEFFGVSGTNSLGGAVVWKLPTVGPPTTWGTAASGVRWLNCDTDGAITLANMPLAYTNPQHGSTMICSDSVDPAWTAGSVSNCGKPITGGGIHKVVAIAHNYHLLAASSWSSGATSITTSSTLSLSIVAGMNIADLVAGNPVTIGTVASISSATINLSSATQVTSNASNDTLCLFQWVIGG